MQAVVAVVNMEVVLQEQVVQVVAVMVHRLLLVLLVQ
jgi:hypothetical protein